MFYQTCNRIGYKLLDPHIWEVYGGEYNTESLGFTKNISKTGKFRKCKPPVYEIDPSARDTAKALPKGSTVRKARKSRRKIADLDKRIKELEAELKVIEKAPVLKERWKLSYTWVYEEEIYWDLESKEHAERLMTHIQNVYAPQLVETIVDIKIEKYWIKYE